MWENGPAWCGPRDVAKSPSSCDHPESPACGTHKDKELKHTSSLTEQPRYRGD